LSWHQTVLNDEFHSFALDQLYGADALLFGRVSYEGMGAHWQTATGKVADSMNKLPKYVFSQTLCTAGWSNTTLVREDPAQAVRRIK
jgi:dihydrofolate reductase